MTRTIYRKHFVHCYPYLGTCAFAVGARTRHRLSRAIRNASLVIGCAEEVKTLEIFLEASFIERASSLVLMRNSRRVTGKTQM